jgi:hypothetical protein
MTWLQLSEATTLIAHDVQKARARLERAISKAWLVGPGVQPQNTSDPNVPLRARIVLAPGLITVSRDWLEDPVLDWESSQILCLCKPWLPLGRVSPEPPTASLAQIEVWQGDLERLWGGHSTDTANGAETSLMTWPVSASAVERR